MADHPKAVSYDTVRIFSARVWPLLVIVITGQIDSLGCRSARALIAAHDAGPVDGRGSGIPDLQNLSPGVDGGGLDLPGLVSGAMILEYNRNDLIVIAAAPDSGDGNVTLASVVLGLSSIEILKRTSDGNYESNLISGPPSGTCQRVPVAIAAIDLDQDGNDEIVVVDSCGAWIVRRQSDGSYGSTDARSVFSTEASGQYALRLADAAGHPVLATGNARAALLSGVNGLLDSSSGLQQFVVPPDERWIHTDVFCPLLSVPSTNDHRDLLLFQGYGAFFRYGSTQDGGTPTEWSLVETVTLSAPQPPYLTPFDGLDHLQYLSLSGCMDSLLGVGMINPSAGNYPRRLQHVTFDTDHQYQQAELSTAFTVATFGVISTPDGGSLVGVLGEDTQGAALFSAMKASSCEDLGTVMSWPIEFEWRTPEAPAFGDFGPRVPKNDGIKLLGLPTSTVGSETYVFINYDGYDVRSWTVALNLQGQPSAVAVSRRTLHETRDDLSFGN